MLKNITRRERKTVTAYQIEFLNGEGGYGFDCDKDGNLLNMTDCAMENYKRCMEHPESWEVWNKKIKNTWSYTEPAHGTCICGREVELWDQYRGACQCECGRWYNLFGQELLDPMYWEPDDDEWEGY